MAELSLKSGGELLSIDPRSSVSRYYYAAYQAVSCLLIYEGLNAPTDREAWSHADTPLLVVSRLSRVIPSLGRRFDIRYLLGLLYKVRLSADYISADDVEPKLGIVRKDAEFIVKLARGVVGAAEVSQ